MEIGKIAIMKMKREQCGGDEKNFLEKVLPTLNGEYQSGRVPTLPKDSGLSLLVLFRDEKKNIIASAIAVSRKPGQSITFDMTTMEILDSPIPEQDFIAIYNNYTKVSLSDQNTILYDKENDDKNNQAMRDEILKKIKDSSGSGLKSGTQNIAFTPHQVLENNKQIILYGPPGTGKTRMAKKLAEELCTDEECIKLIQFHPSYTYYDFVEGIEATEDGFQKRDKIFAEMCKKAFKPKGKQKETKQAGDGEEEKDISENNEKPKYVLIIDEINRANIAEVFGELLYALEYRNQEITTSMGSKLTVPDNLYIIGTMNTADKSISSMDYAIRRRFSFLKVEARFPNGTFSFKDKAGNEDKCTFTDNGITDKERKIHSFSVWKYDDDDNIQEYQPEGEKTNEGRCFFSNLCNRVYIDIEQSVAIGVNIDDIMPGYFLINTDNASKMDSAHREYKIKYEIIPLLKHYAQNGLFSKRNKIHNEKSLIELLDDGEYQDILLKTKAYKEAGNTGGKSA